MPAKNAVKTYAENSFYHMYNRGVEKRDIYIDKQDHKVFLGYLKQYLSPPPDPKTLLKDIDVQGRTFKGVSRQPNNYHQQIELTAFCLMPNHFHLLVRQTPSNAINRLMQSILTRYTMFFNKKYDRVGSLFQGKYKAVLVGEENYLLHLTRYIHLNPQNQFPNLTDSYSSYANYLGLHHAPWVNPQPILDYFNQATLPIVKQINTYKAFVEEYQGNTQEMLGNLTLEEEL